MKLSYQIIPILVLKKSQNFALKPNISCCLPTRTRSNRWRLHLYKNGQKAEKKPRPGNRNPPSNSNLTLDCVTMITLKTVAMSAVSFPIFFTFFHQSIFYFVLSTCERVTLGLVCMATPQNVNNCTREGVN